MHVDKYKQAGSGWKRFVRRDVGMKQKKVAGSGTVKTYVRPSKEGYSQVEVDHLFSSIVLLNITHALSVYGVSESELSIVQQLLDRCFKRRYISKKLEIGELLIKCKISEFVGRFRASRTTLLGIISPRLSLLDTT